MRAKLATTGIIAILTAALWSPAIACVNEYGTDLDGKSLLRQTRRVDLSQVDPRTVLEEWRQKFAFLQQQYRPDAPYTTRSDYAAALIHLGRSKEAIDILLNVEKTNPDLYATASNLGTAYELDGQNEKALEWIKKGIERNSDSHGRSEWIHVRILEAKLALSKDPQWLKSHSTLGMNFGSATRPLRSSMPAVDHEGNEYDVVSVAMQISYQLEERLAFVSAPDAIVADLLFDLANLHATTGTLEVALPLYNMALKFGPANTELVSARRDLTAQIISDATFWVRIRNVGLVCAGCLLLVLLYKIWRRQGSRVY